MLYLRFLTGVAFKHVSKMPPTTTLLRIHPFAVRRRLFGLKILTTGVGPGEIDRFIGVLGAPGVFSGLEAISPDVLRLRRSHTSLPEMSTVNALFAHKLSSLLYT